MLDRLRFGIPMLHPVPDMQPLIDLVWTASAELNHHIKWKTSKEMCRVILHTAIWFWAKIITIRTLYNIMLVITCSCVYFVCAWTGSQVCASVCRFFGWTKAIRCSHEYFSNGKYRICIKYGMKLVCETAFPMFRL